MSSRDNVTTSAPSPQPSGSKSWGGSSWPTARSPSGFSSRTTSSSRQVQSLRDELSEKNRLLERKNRLAALGEMAAGHGARDPQSARRDSALCIAAGQGCERSPGSRGSSWTKISAGVKRLESLVSQVLHFTREISVTHCGNGPGGAWSSRRSELAQQQRDGEADRGERSTARVHAASWPIRC